ncbi:MAG: glycosyltransferase family 4 protein [Anaerolineales bacterium]|jgi:glycosyltransferase involved in cell wall biosynthesis
MTKCALVSNTDWYLFNFRLSLANFLRKRGYEVLLISPPGEYTTRLEAAGFDWFEWQVGRQSMAPWGEIQAVRQLTDLYRQLQPDLVHHHTIKPVLYGSLAAGRAGVPAVVASITGRGYVFEGQGLRARGLQVWIKPLYRRLLQRNNTRVIFENEGDRQFFISQGLVAPGRAHLVESVGVDPQRFFPAPEPAGTPVALLAARLLWDKGIGVLVEAARLLRQQKAAIQIVIVGQPDPGNPSSIPVEQLKAWQAEGLLSWWGWQTDMQAVYARSHIVVLPSFHEGVPTGLLEAAACGRPIVASDIPGCRTVVQDGENGFLVHPGEARPLAEALARLAASADLRGRMGKAGRERVLKFFTQEQINQQTLAVYQQAHTSALDGVQ